MTGRLTITSRDLQALTSLVDPERVGSPEEELPATFLTDLAEIVPFSYASFSVIDARHRDERVQDVEVFGADPCKYLAPDVLEEMNALWWPAYWDDGGCSYVEDTGDRVRVLRSSDQMSQRERARTPMGRAEACLGVTAHEVMVSLPPIGLYERRLMLWRSSGRDFSDREVMLLQLLRPHLVAVHGRQRRQGVADLTTRQWEIMRLVATGLTNTQVARALDVSESTIRTHLEHVYNRLGVGTRTAALARLAPVMDTW